MRLLRGLLSIALLREFLALRMFALGCLGMIGARADTAGILTWDGDPTVTAVSLTGSYGQNLITPYFNPYILSADANGISSSLGVGYATVVGTDINAIYSIHQQFTVKSAGDFLLTELGTGTTTGLICNPGNCGGMGFDLNAISFGLLAGNSVSLPIPSPSDPGYDDFINSHLYDSVTVNASNSEILFLNTGTYTLDQNVNALAWSADYPGMDLSVT